MFNHHQVIDALRAERELDQQRERMLQRDPERAWGLGYGLAPSHDQPGESWLGRLWRAVRRPARPVNVAPTSARGEAFALGQAPGVTD
jgi:hypothetical protein